MSKKDIFIIFIFCIQLSAQVININSQNYRYLRWQNINEKTVLNFQYSPNSIIAFDYFRLKTISKFGIFKYRGEVNSKFSSSNIPHYKFIGSFYIKLLEDVSIQNDFRILSSNEGVSDYIGTKRPTTGNWRGDFIQSFVRYSKSNIFVLYGRTWLVTNPLSDGLLVNKGSPNPEMVWLHFEPNQFEIDYNIIFLDTINHFNRIMFLHRYGYKSEYVRFGFTDASIIRTSNLSVNDLMYLNPASFFLELQENRGSQCNMMWLFDLQCKFKKLTTNFELLIDDISLDRESPNKIASLFGLGYSTNSAGKYYLEYVRINRWVYNYGFDMPELRWVQDGINIGHPIGNDGQQVKISSFKKIYNKNKIISTLEFELFWIERGQGTIFEPTPVKSGSNFGYSSEPFPFGNISHLKLLRTRLDIFFSDSYYISSLLSVSKQYSPKYSLSISIRM